MFMTVAADPWWTMTGAASSNLLSLQVSPYYLRSFASGFVAPVPFAGVLGTITRVLLFLGSLTLAGLGLRPSAWWREFAVFFSLSALSTVYLSFLLMYHNAVTSLLGAYGVLPPYSGSANLPTVVLGLDLNNYSNPLVIAGFGLPFYLGFACAGLVGVSLMINRHGKSESRTGSRGVEAIFTPKQ